MTWLVSDELEAVELDACHCPGTPHEHDTIWLHPSLSAAGGLAGMLAIRQSSGDEQDLETELGRVYAEFGIARWSFVDAEGRPVPVVRETIRRMAWNVMYPVANKASELYSEDLLRPLVARASKSSGNGHTAPSTSVRKRSSTTRRKR